MWSELLIGTALGTMLGKKKLPAKSIKSATKTYAVVSDSKINGAEAISIVFLTSDKQEALTWINTAIEVSNSIFGMDFKEAQANSGDILEYVYEASDNKIYYYGLFEI